MKGTLQLKNSRNGTLRFSSRSQRLRAAYVVGAPATGVRRRTRCRCKERELRDLQKRISKEVESLIARIKGKNFLLGAREIEIKSFKQTTEQRIEELKNIIKKPCQEGSSIERGALQVSFLVDYGKEKLF